MFFKENPLRGGFAAILSRAVLNPQEKTAYTNAAWALTYRSKEQPQTPEEKEFHRIEKNGCLRIIGLGLVGMAACAGGRIVGLY